MFEKRKLLKRLFGGFLFATLYSIGISIVTGFELMAFLQNVFILTVIFFVVTTITEFLFRLLSNSRRK